MKLLLTAIAAFSVYAGFAAYEASRTPSYVDVDGTLHEPFTWIATAAIAGLLTVALVILGLGILLFSRWRNRKHGK